MFYRVSDKGYDNTNVKDTTLHTKFGDLSDGSNYVLSVKTGTDSSIALLDFQVTPPAHYDVSNSPVMAGFDFNFVNVKVNENDTSGAAGTIDANAELPNCNIYLMKEDNVMENEGDVSIVNSAGQDFDNRLSAGATFERDNLAVFIANQHFNSSSLAYTEMFSQTSDVNVNKHTTQGVVAETKNPYITLKVADDKRGILTKGYNKETLRAFYGTVHTDGSDIVPIKAAKDDAEFPPEKWKPGAPKGEKGGIMSGMVGVGLEAAGLQGLVQAPTATMASAGYMANPAMATVMSSTGKTVGFYGSSGGTTYQLGTKTLEGGSKMGNMKESLGLMKGKHNLRMANANQLAKGPAGKGLIKKAGWLGVAVGGYEGWNKGKDRADSIKAAKASGDFSGVKRPTFEPVWKHKKIKDDIKYAITKEYGTTFQLDENAVTNTSSWWDKVKEVRDYEKLETHLAGFSGAASEDQSYGSDEEKLAKSSINFVTGKEGNCMHMMAYTDYDTSQNVINQPVIDFSATDRPLQQDIYVSKYNLPRPAQFFQNNTGGAHTSVQRIGVGSILDGSSVAAKQPTDSYEISFDMMVGNLPVPYAVLYDQNGNDNVGEVIKPLFRRGIAVTFSDKKPKDNECFYDYIKRHTDATGSAGYSSRIMGWVIEKKLSFTGGQATFGSTLCIPIAARTGAGASDHAVNLYRTSANNTDSNLIDLVTVPGNGVEIPASTWLRFKMSTNLHGGNGKANDRPSRAHLTIHDAGTGEIIDAQKSDGDDAGPIELLSPFPECDTDFVSPAVEDDQPFNRDGEWLPHMSIWVINHRYNSGGYLDEIGDRSYDSGSDPANDVFFHDWFQKNPQKGAVGETNLASQAVHADPYELAKTECWVDNMYIRGAEPKLTNMSVNEENPANIPSNNIFNNDDVFAVQNAPIGGGDPVTTTAPTVIAMGFETTTNIAGGTGSNSKFLLFNDFWADNDPCMKLINDGSTSSGPSKVKGDATKHDLYAGYSKGAEKAGDWIDAYSTRTTQMTAKLDENLTSTESSPTTFDVDSGFVSELNNGDIIKINSEKLLVTAINSATSITAKRAQYGTTQANHTDGATMYVVGRSNFRELTIGHTYQSGYTQDEPDIKTHAIKTAQEEAYDNGTTGKVYVEGFSQKGVVQVQNAMTDWVRRECIYASTRIVAIGNKDDHEVESVNANIANVKVGNPSVFNFKKGISGEKYIVYRYGTTIDYTDASGNAAIVTLDNKGDFVQLRRHVGTDLGSGKKGTRLNNLITEANLPELFISPWRYWLCIATDAMDKAVEQNPLYSNSPDEDLEYERPGERGYGSICSIKPPIFSDATTSSGYDMGTTFNEQRFTVDDVKRRTFDIGPDAAYETDVDFGLGSYDMELAGGGEVTNFQARYASNRINLDNILKGLTPEAGDVIGLVVSANSENTTDSQLHFWSGDFTANATNMPKQEADAIPQLVTKYVMPSPRRPGLGVIANEGNPYYPELQYAADVDNLWYGYILISEDNITNKYHGVTAYAPLNENADKPWLGKPSTKRGGNADTLKKMKLYGSEEAIGRDDLGLAGQGDHKLVYATDTGAFDGSFAGQQTASYTTRQTIEGLAGRALDTRGGGSTLTFPYVGGKSMSIGDGKKLSVVMHIIPDTNAADGTLMEIGSNNCLSIKCTSGKIVARLYSNSSVGDYVELTSTTSIARDNVTPTCIIFTFDLNLLNANCKLYINGVLEDQSSSLKPAHSTANKEWQYDKTHVGGASKNMVIGGFKGIYEELLIYNKVVLPIEIDSENSSVLVERNLEEIINKGSTQYNNGNGLPQTWNARLFVFDYHNLRGSSVAASPQVSWRKTAFPIDPRNE